MTDGERTFRVDLMTRVEGEGRFELRVRDGVVERAMLSIYEAPRFFEAFVRGRSIDEVPDVVARICGICPVAYQMSAVRALENALGLTPTPTIRALRRLFYCGEWISSHALHVFLLHAPDFLGFPGALEMAAAGHRDLVERGLRIKKAGNAIMERIGGRAVHPISARVGGFTRLPTVPELRALRDDVARALDEAVLATRWAATLDFPDFAQDYVFVSLVGDAYPLEWADEFAVTGRGTMPVAAFEEVVVEAQVPWSNALQARLDDGATYLTGPMARLAHNAERLHPRARAAMADAGLTAPVLNPHVSIVVRCVEIVHALAEALDLIDAYAPEGPAYLATPPRFASGLGATEAPRGLLYHRYAIDAEGLVREAVIVPPTSQNQARIEQDLIGMAPQLLELEHESATRLCERLIRAYDPCISCATHFLTLDIQRVTS
jgi:coenzyme F420-reducing hydrogenase alpha subunit